MAAVARARQAGSSVTSYCFILEHIQAIDPAWRGLTMGLVESIRELGDARYAELALQNIGEFAEYGDLRFKSPEKMKRMVVGEGA